MTEGNQHMEPTICPVCNAPFLVFVTHKKTVRTQRDLPVFGCLACQSFSNPSGYVESMTQMANDLEWHKNVAERNDKATDALILELLARNVDISRIVDIGAGIGTLLKTAKKYGSVGIGYEVNPLTQPYAREVNDVDVRAEFWDTETPTGPFSLMVCIMVLEHIVTPRDLLRNMVTACKANGAALFVSVPFMDRNRWHFLHDSDPKSPGTQFFDNDVHVTHFSSMAMENVLREFGMTSVEWIRKGLWHGPLAHS